MGDAREKNLLEVPEHRLEGLARFRGRLGQTGADLAGLHPREHGEALDALVIVGDPVDELVAEAAEVAARHVEVFLVAHEWVVKSRRFARQWTVPTSL